MDAATHLMFHAMFTGAPQKQQGEMSLAGSSGWCG
jgi:hypothetical protein